MLKNITSHMRRKFRFIALSVAAFVALTFCYRLFTGTSPPDLRGCTRFEVRYPPSTLSYFFPSTTLQQSVLSPDEREYIQSIEFFTVDDPNRISHFAHDVSQGSYDHRLGLGKVLWVGRFAAVDCYRDDKHIVSFKVFEGGILTEDKRIFKYPRGLPDVKIIEPAELQPFKLRWKCGSNMHRIYTEGPLYRKEVRRYPEPAEWCDAVMRDRTNKTYVSEKEMRGRFKCPNAGEGGCHYAINPHCVPNSPPDTVLLFETEAGWNKFGGPELFSFDHHEPRGGCVLLNDGTVKFIRTEEELRQLQWE